MYKIEPFYNWRLYYKAEEDVRSIFYQSKYSEFELSNTIYNYYIHPQWDYFGSDTLYLKILFVDYKNRFAIIELIGEWNDAIENDIMHLKKNVIQSLQDWRICKFIIIAENVLNFFRGDDEHYTEWHEEVNEKKGWITIINLPSQSKYEFDYIKKVAMIHYIQIDNWRNFLPALFYQHINKIVNKTKSSQ